MRTLDESLLDTATQRLVAESQPEEIWLVGLHGWGTPTADSDLDLMVIVPASNERPFRRDPRTQASLGRLLFVLFSIQASRGSAVLRAPLARGLLPFAGRDVRLTASKGEE